MPPTTETGRTGLLEFTGVIQEEFLTELRGKEGYKRFNEMRWNSPVVAAMLLAIEQSVRTVQWTYASDEGVEDPRLELLNMARDNMTRSWDDHIIDALSLLAFGYSIFEIVYERIEGRMLWRKFAFRGQDTVHRWLFDERGGLEGFIQQTTMPAKQVEIPIGKLVLYRIRSEKNNPEGKSILRPAWIPYYYTKHLQQIEAIGIERDLAGLPVITLPKGATTDENDTTSDAYKAGKIVRNLRNDEQSGLVLVDGWEFELASTGGQRAFDTDKIVRRYESRTLMAALAQFLMLGQDSVGSFALSRDQGDFFVMAVNAVADIISETHTKFAIPRLMRLNGQIADGLRLEHTPAGDIDIMALADFLQKIGAKVTWTVEDEMWLRAVSGMPEKSLEELQAEFEKKEARSAAFLQNIQRGRHESPDDLSIELYQIDEPPDEGERTRIERKWARRFRSFTNDQMERILKGVRRIARGS